MVEECGSDAVVTGMASTDLMEYRWVFQDSEEEEEEEEEEDELQEQQRRGGGESEEDEGGGEQKLVRTGPRVDSFDMEAPEVPGAERDDHELLRTLALAEKLCLHFRLLELSLVMLGPLYTFSVMFTKAPINGNEDVLGALSLVIYTLILIPLVKYALVVLWANDDGGTFALYSLICRHAKVSLLPNQLPSSDARISNFRLKVPPPELERSLRLKERLGTVRAPGIGLLYNELVKGVPAIFGHFLTTLPAVHSMIIIVCIKYVPVPMVLQGERILFRRVCQKSCHIFRCIARYGYKDVRKENHHAFEQLLIESLEKFICREAQERSLESDGDEEESDSEGASSSTRLLVAPSGSLYSLGVPLLSKHNADPGKPIHDSEAGTSAPSTESSTLDPEQSLEWELSFIRQAKESRVVYLLGHGDIRARKDSWFIKKLIINYFYAFLRKNCRSGIANLGVPHTHLMQVSMTYMV